MPVGTVQTTAVIVTGRWDGSNCDYYFDDMFFREVPVISGCTDPLAGNYNSDANLDDGSCGEYALSFDGVDDYVNLSNPPSDIFSQLTWSVWVKGHTGYIYAVGGGGTHYFAIDDNFFPVFGLSGSNVTSSTPVSANEWNHLAGVYNGETKKIFVNGIETGSSSFTGGIDANFTSTIGYASGSLQISSPAFYQGQIDEVTVWDTALSQEEIFSGMLNGHSGSESGLAGYWDFNEGIDTVLTDQSINNNDGVIHGAAWVSDPFVTVFFNLDLTDQAVSNNGVHIAGTFQGWDSAANEMTDDDGNGIYSYAAAFTPGDTIEYKFINGNSWDDPADYVDDLSCGRAGQYGNRWYIVPNTSAVMAP
ncbi:MAG TPA: LamG-like jellyroll fold domain-containing protein, partial [Candidatus Marinimicrobia bacterium]|nr:LamG-like jellyroll fold domain-containing protein [Candidatus Neomarinimicrobiota bacterium]